MGQKQHLTNRFVAVPITLMFYCWISFENVKGPLTLFIEKNPFSAALDKKCGLSTYIHRVPTVKADSEKPIHIQANRGR